MMAGVNAADRLKHVPLFQSLDRKEIDQLAKLATEQHYKAGTTIVNDGAAGHGLYIVVDGEVSVVKDGRVLARFRSGDFFGEMAVLDGGPRTAAVQADSDTTCLVLASWDIRALLMDNAGMTYKMLQEVVRRLRGSGAQKVGD
jgi:CRP-like cAMP-binding protein